MPRPRHSHLPTLKRLVGTVISAGMDRTAVVGISRLYIHPKTSKIMKLTSKYFCHDAHEICGVGDRVQIRYWGAISKKKRFTVIDMVHRHPQLEGEPFQMSRLKNPPSVEEVKAMKAAAAEQLLKEANGQVGEVAAPQQELR